MRYLVVVFLALITARTWAQPPSPEALCVQAYNNNMIAVDQRTRLVLSLRTVYQNHCSNSSSSNSTSFGAELSALIGNVPVVENWTADRNANDQESFCRAYEEDESLFGYEYNFTSNPVIEAQKNLNQCIQISRRGNVVITHEKAPGSVIFHFGLTSTETNFSIQGVTSNTFSCQISRQNRRPVQLSTGSFVPVVNNFNIVCQQKAEISLGNEYYPFDTIMIANNIDSPYVVSVNEETIFGPTRQSEAKQQIESLESSNSVLSNTIDRLNEDIASASVSHHFFYVHSGERGLVNPAGDFRDWYSVMTGDGGHQPNINDTVRNWYCPDAHSVSITEVYRASGGGLGNVQFAATCLYIGSSED
ncbi:MAG: hypothetical protein R3F50_17090 [Gammaproteobacteria bacterium]